MTTHAPPDHPGGAFPPLPIVTDHDVVIVKQRDGRHSVLVDIGGGGALRRQEEPAQDTKAETLIARTGVAGSTPATGRVA